MLLWRFLTLIALSVSFLGAQQTASGKVIQILATADTHAEILPRDNYSMVQANKGWARLASAIKEEKRKTTATLLVDCGDTLQGSPFAYIHNSLRSGAPNPVVEIMNSLGYQAMVPGSHDFNVGASIFKAAEKQATFPIIAANVVDPTGKPLFKPYAMTVIDGISVALLGLTLPATPNSFNEQNMPMVFKDIFETASEWVPKLRKNEKADIVIVLLHTGAESLRRVPNNENNAILLAESVADIDAVIASQSHHPLAFHHNGVPILQPSPFGQSIASITFSLLRTGGRWTVHNTSPTNIPLNPALSLDAQVLQATDIINKETEAYLNTHATQLNTDLDGRWTTTEPTPLLQLLNDVQQQATGSQLSAASSPGTHIFIPKGPTSVRQFFALAPHEHRVTRIRITGAQLRAYLEHAATYFNFSYLPELINRGVSLADYDIISGCNYALDISRPPGKRVTKLEYAGNPVQDEQFFTMAISSYRLAGGGGYMDAIGFNDKAEMISKNTLRNLLFDYVLSRQSLTIHSSSGDWRTVPFLERERVIAAQKNN